jgi:hypothetical protein
MNANDPSRLTIAIAAATPFGTTRVDRLPTERSHVGVVRLFAPSRSALRTTASAWSTRMATNWRGSNASSELPDELRTLVENGTRPAVNSFPRSSASISVSSFRHAEYLAGRNRSRCTTRFVLKGEEDIRRLDARRRLLIADSHGIHFLIRDRYALDAA